MEVNTVLDDWDHGRPYYHGSPQELSVIREGSTITQDKELARVFSHKPSMVSQGFGESGTRSIKHTGRSPGYLYRISEVVGPEDIYPHPTTSMEPGQEWLTRKDLTVELITRTEILDSEVLTEVEVAELRKRHKAQH
jgi:hypothetical protein